MIWQDFSGHLILRKRSFEVWLSGQNKADWLGGIAALGIYDSRHRKDRVIVIINEANRLRQFHAMIGDFLALYDRQECPKGIRELIAAQRTEDAFSQESISTPPILSVNIEEGNT